MQTTIIILWYDYSCPTTDHSDMQHEKFSWYFVKDYIVETSHWATVCIENITVYLSRSNIEHAHIFSTELFGNFLKINECIRTVLLSLWEEFSDC